MKRTFRTLEFDVIINRLQEYALTDRAKEELGNLKPYLSENELRLKLRDTTEARLLLDTLGTPPIPTMSGIENLVDGAVKGEILLPSELEMIGVTLSSVKRLKDYLGRGKSHGIGLSYRSDELDSIDELRDEIFKTIRGGKIDDFATNELRDIRRKVSLYEDKIKSKAEELLRGHKEYFSDSFIVNRNGHTCLPVKKDYKLKVSGSVIDKSSTGATLFIEPTAISKLNEELQLLKLDEENEERKILYTLAGMVADKKDAFYSDIETIVSLDFVFAKGKLSASLNAKEPQINTKRYMVIKQGRHPFVDEESCVPLDFMIGSDGINMGSDEVNQGIVITGPNTGGKTVAIKTVGLFSIMAQCGLHLPCESSDICMNSQVLCDIGDGQNITENLSTFSAHITNILHILRKVNEESLVILDELGSGTDPAEGMGIAIAILEQLKLSGCIFLATTHYPEIKTYAEKEKGITNARMAFDRETLKPLYKLEIGKVGESCALYIAKRLGMPDDMIKRASMEAYGNYDMPENKSTLNKEYVPKIQKRKESRITSNRSQSFNLGDCVMIYPEKKLGIVAGKANMKGEILVQCKKEKKLINHKRIKLHVAASMMYPEDYDFSIIFDTVANRKARHDMGRKHQEDVVIILED